MKNKPLLAALACLLWLGKLAITTAATPLAMTPFEARYTVYGKGLPIGESIMTLTDDGNGRYSMRSEVRPNALAALVISGYLSERVNGELREGIVYPQNYEQQRSGGRESKLSRLRFDWQQHSLQAQEDGEQVTLPLTAGVVDPLSLHLQVMQDLRRGRTPSQYTLVDDAQLKTYQVRFEGEETLKTPLGNLRTLRFNQSKPGASRVTLLWFAPSLNYLAVQIIQKKKGNEELRMLIEHLSSPEAK
jgi:hypothetical protein